MCVCGKNPDDSLAKQRVLFGCAGLHGGPDCVVKTAITLKVLRGEQRFQDSKDFGMKNLLGRLESPKSRDNGLVALKGLIVLLQVVE